ncbi:MAG: phosphorylase family protein [Candidatus Limnocylindrales bacterium]
MSSIVDNDTWFGQRRYVSAAEDLRHHGLDPAEVAIGTACLVVFSSGLFRTLDGMVPKVVTNFEWPYSTTPLRVSATPSGKRFGLHFPSYGGSRIANSLEQLAACGVQQVIGLGLGGTPQNTVEIGDIVLLEGALRGDGVSRYYSPVEYPAVADLELTARLRAQLVARDCRHHFGLSFGTDALYREEGTLVERLKELGVLTIDLESSAFLTVGRRLGLKCSWIGEVSDRLNESRHEGNIHSEHVMDRLLRLSELIIEVIDSEP